MKRAFQLLLLALTLPAQGLVVRGYNAAAHDRFTGFKANPVANLGFLSLNDTALFTGVCWQNEVNNDKQFTMITPRHFVCASHFKPGPGETVRFLDSTGAVITRTVASLAVIPHPSGNTDLTVGTLSIPIPPTVAHYPYLNLANENAYLGEQLVVLGKVARGARGSIADFDEVTFSLPNGDAFKSKCFIFNYNTLASGVDDCHFEGGDSGSPSFVMVGGKPALVGIHSAVDTNGPIISNYDTFVPHYVTQVDAQLQSSGYRMAPAHFTATTLGIPSASASPVALRRSHPGQIAFSVANTGAPLTGNLAVTVTFPVGQQPASLSAPGWVVESAGSGIWNLRAATLAGGASLAFTATWTELPDLASITPSISADSDTAPAIAATPSFTLAPSYAEWAEGLALPGQTEDSDGDGLENLLEYAFGGAGGNGVMTLPGGHPLLPVMTHPGGMVSLTYPERDDALLRGLSYVVETSTSPATLAGAIALPPGAATTTAPFSPPVPGFVRRTLTWPADGPRRFARVKVELAE